MREKRKIRRAIAVLVLGLALQAGGAARASEQTLEQIAHLFPSRGFEDRIAFWKDVFATYSVRQVALHDIDDLRLVYHVETFARGIDNDSEEARRQREVVRVRREAIEGHLRELASKGLDSDQLSEGAEKLAEILKKIGEPMPADKLIRMSSNVRGQRGIREKFEAGLIRSGRYLDRIERVFETYGLPVELTLLPHVESSFDYSAYSRAGAAGIWQFTRGTGRMFLQINELFDERLDPIRSTDAAARLLQENYKALGNWPLAVTAYNHGKYGMLRAQRLHGSDLLRIIDQYQGRSFGFASKNFYPEFLAAIEIARNYEEYFGPLEFEGPLQFETIRLDRAYDVSFLTSVPGLDSRTLRQFNPHFRLLAESRSRTLPSGIEVRVPPGLGVPLEMALRSAPAASETIMVAADGSTRYRVQWGDALGLIASRFGTSVRALQDLNGISNPNRIRPGQVLLISQGSAPQRAAASAPSPAEPARYQVRSGDSLASIATRFNTSVDSLQLANGIRNPDLIRPGQVLVISERPPRQYTVRRGDTLQSIAQRFGASIQDIQTANQIRNANQIRQGQQLLIP